MQGPQPSAGREADSKLIEFPKCPAKAAGAQVPEILRSYLIEQMNDAESDGERDAAWRLAHALGAA